MQSANSSKRTSPFLTCFPLLPTAEPCGQGHTHCAHIKRRRFIMPLVALVQKNRAHQRLRTNTGAWGSLSRRRCSSRSVFEQVSACIRSLRTGIHKLKKRHLPSFLIIFFICLSFRVSPRGCCARGGRLRQEFCLWQKGYPCRCA